MEMAHGQDHRGDNRLSDIVYMIRLGYKTSEGDAEQREY